MDRRERLMQTMGIDPIRQRERWRRVRSGELSFDDAWDDLQAEIWGPDFVTSREARIRDASGSARAFPIAGGADPSGLAPSRRPGGS